ncbi:hypothetical protein CEJ42_09330 [Herbaspirillum robiniae]|uniref:Uncharacterized protein n=1 Tax=Herbaspirillum robiniae TaxID=2014887 RepID=A0A2D0B5U3_9BURK|nr:hypothetical protein CEJ42_09330 [Herbaspirillum robiniae]
MPAAIAAAICTRPLLKILPAIIPAPVAGAVSLVVRWYPFVVVCAGGAWYGFVRVVPAAGKFTGEGRDVL